MYDINCDILSTSFQTSVGNVFKMAAHLTFFMCETVTMLKFFSDYKT